MPKRISTPKRPKDINQLAKELVRLSTQETSEAEPTLSRSEISRVMADMGRKGGKIGGKRRLKTLSKAKRSEIARKAARERWKRHAKLD
jgi:hypothetical protein